MAHITKLKRMRNWKQHPRSKEAAKKELSKIRDRDFFAKEDVS